MARVSHVFAVGQYRLQKLGDGWAAVWVDEGGVRRRYRLGETDAGAARQALERFARGRELIRGKEAKDIAGIWGAYLADRRAEDKRSVEIMEHNWKALAPRFGHLTPAMIDKQVCREYVNARRKLGRAESTILTELRRIQTCLNWAADNAIIEKAPTIWMPPEPKARERWLTRAEVHKLIDGANSPHVKLFIILAIASAGRSEAILDLTWDRVDFESGLVFLHDPDRDRTTKGRATVPMNDTARAALATAKAAALTPYVIEWKQAKLGSIKKGFAEAVRRAGIEHCTPHDLRRTAASWMVMAGVPLQQVAHYLGHKSTRMVEQVYGHFAPDYLSDAAKAVDLQLLRPVKKVG